MRVRVRVEMRVRLRVRWRVWARMGVSGDEIEGEADREGDFKA